MGGLIFIAVVIAWLWFYVWLARKVVSWVPIESRAPCVALLMSATLLSGCEKYKLDRQMEAMCKKDGGVRVYETVKLPPEMFDHYGDPFPGWQGRSDNELLGSNYEYLSVTDDLVKGDALRGEGELRKFRSKIVRRKDGKIMGEAVYYGRSGGDFIALAHPTSKGCPINQSDSDLIRQVFINQGK